MVLFKYDDNLTLSVINRRQHKKDAQKDVLEKVTLIQGISISHPHRAHVEILFDLSLDELRRVYKCSNFVELDNAWQKTLDIKELNKRFYEELSNWYFWAIKEVTFPGLEIESDKDSAFLQEDAIHDHNAKNLIRLLTRLLFVWFFKEKHLIPEEIFDEKYIDKQLIYGFEACHLSESKPEMQKDRYYRAILQNLFFATLNQYVGKRSFRLDSQQMNITNLMRYKSYFRNPLEFIIMLDNMVPFINGGLFESLDHPDSSIKGKLGGDFIIYQDGFSDRKDNILNVPDFLFFAKEVHVDLSGELRDKKKKDVEVSGIICILKKYKFTVTENTPIEEDVALDPELLGRVFESLLASYNPETKVTARKQTGSFYTPREIVDYMVDESLKSYLKQKLITFTKMNSEDADIGLEFLLGYYEKEHLFNLEETKVLIEAIDECKILDPACGSGAFPMGILHKFVHILHKLDPFNKLWKERQITKALKIDDPQIRDNAVEEIELAFNSIELDYGRKLFLIENCIYGVDIQPIAIQISKLRFLISLIVDQRPEKGKSNFGIRPLPNLETNFVAANTLIRIEKQTEKQDLFANDEIREYEKQLEDIRHNIFSAKTPSDKRDFKEQDKSIRVKMSLKLEELMNDECISFVSKSKESLKIEYYKDMIHKHGETPEYLKEIKKLKDKLSKSTDVLQEVNRENAHKLASWDPYNQNKSGQFFDPEWMYGITEGFDVMIGNPPYISALDFSKIYSKKLREIYNNQFHSAKGSYDYYVLFFEQGLSLCKKEAILCFITPNKYLAAKYAEALRAWILQNASLVKILDVSKIPVFEEVSVYPIISVLKKCNEQKSIVESVLPKPIQSDILDLDDYEKYMIPHELLSKLPENIWGFLLSRNFDMLNPIMRHTKPLDEFGEVNATTTASEADEYGKMLTNNETINSKKVINTGTIEPYVSQWGISSMTDSGQSFLTPYLTLDDTLINQRRIDMYCSPKVIYAKIAKSCEAVVDINSEYASLNTNCFYNPKKDITIEYVGAISNSKLFMFIYDLFFGALRMSGGYYQFQAPQLRVIPIADNSSKPSALFDQIVRIMMLCIHHKIAIKIMFFSDLINAMVYELYFPEEIKSADAEVLKHLTNLPELKDEWSDQQKMEVIEKVYQELSDPKHPVSIAMAKQKTVPEVRIIEGLERLTP